MVSDVFLSRSAISDDLDRSGMSGLTISPKDGGIVFATSRTSDERRTSDTGASARQALVFTQVM